MSISDRPGTFRKDEVEDYERRRYRGWDQRFVHFREGRILDRIFREVGASGPLSVLDAPCGFGRFSRFLLERAGFLASGDLSLAMVERAASRDTVPVRALGVVTDLKLGLPFVSRSFTLVFSMRFFHHLHESRDRRAVLAEFNRVSRRWAVVSFYRWNPLHSLQRSIRRAAGRGRIRISMISREEFIEDARQAGWRVARLYPLLRGLHGQTIALLKRMDHPARHRAIKT